MSITILPYNLKLRSYQKDVWQSMFLNDIKRLIIVWHRRAGKDKISLNIIIANMFKRVGSYYYLFPELKQANRVIWKGIDKDGKRFLDHFPPQHIKRIDNSDMTIEFNNGSIFKLCGSDRYDALMGSNPVGIVFSEYSLQNPICWDLMQPILAENGGWALFNYTPRGQNHGFDLLESTKDKKNWFTQVLTVNDTKNEDGSPVITKDAIQESLSSGMDDDLVKQEFYCSFTAAVKGSYFSSQLKNSDEQGKILDFPIDTSLPVNTYWDLGVNDKTSIWFIQPFKFNEFRCINYYENCGEGLNHYINYLKDFRDKYCIVYGEHYMPHDINVTEWGTGESRYITAKKAGLSPICAVPRIKRKIDAIEMARRCFSQFLFHKTNCKVGLAALRQYSKRYNEITKSYSDVPNHDWASNGADAFLQAAQSMHKEKLTKQPYFNNRVNQGEII